MGWKSEVVCLSFVILSSKMDRLPLSLSFCLSFHVSPSTPSLVFFSLLFAFVFLSILTMCTTYEEFAEKLDRLDKEFEKKMEDQNKKFFADKPDDSTLSPEMKVLLLLLLLFCILFFGWFFFHIFWWFCLFVLMLSLLSFKNEPRGWKIFG